MRLQTKILAFLLPLFAVSAVAQTVILRNAVRANLIGTVARQALGVLANEVEVGGLVDAVESGREFWMLSRLQSLKGRLQAVHVMVLDGEGRVVAHTNVALKGRRPPGDFTRQAVALPGPVRERGDLDGLPVMNVSVPLWSLPSPDSEAQLFNIRSRLGTVCAALPLADALESARHISRWLLLVIAGVAALVLLLALVLIRRILDPVRQLAVLTEKIAARDFGARVHIRSKDEIGGLAASFNRMIETLAQTTVSKEYMDAIVENMLDALVVTDLRGNILTVNRATCDLLGYAESELVGRKVDGLLSAASATSWEAGLSHIVKDNRVQNREIALVTKDGRELTALFSGAALKDKSGRVIGIVGMAKDITERKRAEVALRKLGIAVEQTTDAVLITDTAGVIEYVNPAFEKLTGYGASEALGRKPSLLKSGRHPRAFYEELWKTILAGQPFHAVFSNRRKTGEVYIEEKIITPIKDADDRITHFLATSRDITERKRLEAQMLLSEKLSAVGQLAAGVAHEINNPLGVILGFAQGVVRRLKEGDPLDFPLRSIEREALRCKNLVQDLLTYSRGTRGDREPLELNAAVEGAISLVEARARIVESEVRKELGEGLPRILANKNQLQQIVINIANNALDATPKGGCVTIRTALERNGVESWVVLQVRDTGAGIPPEVLPRIFEPFFTTKQVGKGTGLGLSLVYEIVQKHSGRVDVSSRPGETVFNVRFPVRTGDEAERSGTGPAASSAFPESEAPSDLPGRYLAASPVPRSVAERAAGAAEENARKEEAS